MTARFREPPICPALRPTPETSCIFPCSCSGGAWRAGCRRTMSLKEAPSKPAAISCVAPLIENPWACAFRRNVERGHREGFDVHSWCPHRHLEIFCDGFRHRLGPPQRGSELWVRAAPFGHAVGPIQKICQVAVKKLECGRNPSLGEGRRRKHPVLAASVASERVPSQEVVQRLRLSSPLFGRCCG